MIQETEVEEEITASITIILDFSQDFLDFSENDFQLQFNYSILFKNKNIANFNKYCNFHTKKQFSG